MLAAPWFLGLMAFLSSLITSAVLLYSAVKKLPPPAPAVVEVNPAVTAPPPVIWNFKTEAVQDLINELKESNDGMLARQKDLSTLEARISAERLEVEKVKQDVLRMRQELDRRIVEVQENEAKNLKVLAQTYSSMAPSAAVPILHEMDEDIVVKIFSLMKSERVGILLGEMARVAGADKSASDSPARRAARISDKLRLMKGLKKEVAQ
jgi:hypothetical protein